MDKTKQKIQELVPEIMDLKKGCIIQNVVGGTHEIMGYLKNKPYIIEYYQENISVFEVTDTENIKILGRPITLADVLLAMERIMGIKPTNRGGDLIYLWDLTKPYDDQSQETKDFIGQILGVE